MNTHVARGVRRAGAGLPRRVHHRGGARRGAARASRPRSAPTAWPPRRSRSAAPRRSRSEFFGDLTESPKLASFCLTEPDAGSDVSGMRTKAVKQGDKYVLNGSKCFITNGGYADWFTVYAKTDPEAGHRGISAFLVRKDDTVIVDKKEDKMGQRASNTATITFNDTEVPRRVPPRRGEQGLQARDDDPRPHAPRRRGHGGRHRPRRVRVRHASTPRSASSSACRSRCTRRSSS